MKEEVCFFLKRGVIPFTVIILVLLSACAEQEGFLLSEEGRYAVHSIPQGAVVLSEKPLSVGLDTAGEQAGKLKVSLFNAQGELLETRITSAFDRRSQRERLDILDGLPEGSYTLGFEVYDNDILLHSEKRFFFVSRGPLSLNGLETFPSGIQPGRQVRAEARISFPEGSEPWIVWTLDKKVLQQGPVSLLGQNCRFGVPRKEGVYSLKAELFPVKPAKEQFSRIYADSDLFVRILPEGEKSPSALSRKGREYLFYADFTRSKLNSIPPGKKPLEQGQPREWTSLDLTGLAFNEDDGLAYPMVLPGTKKTGSFDFTLSLSFLYEDLPGTGIWELCSLENETGGFYLHYDALKQALVCQLEDAEEGGLSSVLPVDKLTAEEVLALDISYRQSPEWAVLRWESLGELLIRDEGQPVSWKKIEKLNLGSDGQSKALPLVWQQLALFTADAGSKNSFSKLKIYEKGLSVPESITSGRFILGKTSSSLDVLLEGESANWTLVIKDARGQVLYSEIPDKKEFQIHKGQKHWLLPISLNKNKLIIHPHGGASASEVPNAKEPFFIEFSQGEEPGGLENIQAVYLLRNEQGGKTLP